MCDEAVDGTQVDVLLDESSDGVDMSGTVTVLDSEHVYQGAIFGVDDLRIALPMRDGGQTVIRRQVMRHAPCVVMLVHDCANDLYLIEREYRIGCDAFAYGLPAGLIDGGEDVEEAATSLPTSWSFTCMHGIPSNVISTAMSTSNRRGSPGSGCAAPVLRPPIP